MTKITANHLGRAAFVYIRQSTADQLLHNPETREIVPAVNRLARATRAAGGTRQSPTHCQDYREEKNANLSRVER